MMPDALTRYTLGFFMGSFAMFEQPDGPYVKHADALAAVAAAVRSANDARHLLPPITLNARQLHAALQFVNPDAGDADQEESEVCIAYRLAGKSTDGDDAPAGYYAWLAEYPEEGALYLDPDHGDLRPADALGGKA